MLSAHETEGILPSIANKNFINELNGFCDQFISCFSRAESRRNFFYYLIAQFNNSAKKSIGELSQDIYCIKNHSLQRLISNVIWDEHKMFLKYRNMVNEDLGHPDGALIFSETSFPKKGTNSAGVAWQYCANSGRFENCQIAIFSAYASNMGYAVIGKRLFINENWFHEEYAPRRKKCNFPEEIQFKTKPQLAVEILDDIRRQGKPPFKYVLAEAECGNDSEFFHAVEEQKDIIYLVSIPSDTLCWILEPVMRKKKYKYKGIANIKTVLEKTDKKPIPVGEIGENINDYFWYKFGLYEGAKEKRDYEFTKRRVKPIINGHTSNEVWLVIKRTVDRQPEHYYFISNAPENTGIKEFARLSGVHWARRHGFEEIKTNLALDHYKVRKYPGWNHHITANILAHFFLLHQKIRLGNKDELRYHLLS